MVTVSSIVTAPFRAVWFLLTLPFFLLFWLLSLVKTCLLAIVRLPLYYLGRVRRRAAVAWEWTKERGRAKLALPWWGATCVKASQSTQTLEDDEDDDVYSTPLPLSRPSSGHFSTASLRQCYPLLNPELLLKLQREARKRSTSKARRREIAALLELFLQPESPVSSPGESEREEEGTGASGQSYPVIQDENSLRLILELMSLSNTPGDTRDQDEEARKRKARELVSVYHYDRGRLQELISELEAVSFDINSSHKKTKRGKDSSRHSHIRQRGHRSSKSPRSKHTSYRPSPPQNYSDTESDDDACVTAEDGFSDEEEEEPHTSEYHSPPEDLSGSEEEEEEEEEERGERIRAPKRVRSKSHQDSARLRRPPKTAKATVEVGETGTPGEPVPDERPRLGSDRLCSYTGVLSPVHESPEYALTPSNPTSADELESDLNRALLQLDSETSGLQADAREVEYIEQKAAQMSEANQSGSPSPFPSSAPPTPNTVVWKRGKCVEISCTEASKGEEGKMGKEVEAGEREEDNNNKGGEEGGDGEEEGESGKDRGEEGADFAAIPKTAPSLGLKEGHDRQQLAVARSSARRRPPSRHTGTQSESGGSTAGEMMAVDPEMELLEKQLQQSVDTLSTLLEKKERGVEKKEEEEGEEKEEGESGSDGEDDQSEGDFLERRRPPSLSDQMSLLSPGSQRLTARDLSPESALEDSTNSIPNPDPPAGPLSAEGTTPDNAHPPSTPFSSSSRRVVTSTSSSPGAPLLEERGSRPRSRSCDSQRRFGGPLSSSPREKPLMIPSSIPPWLEMRNVSATRIEPMPPKPAIHTLTPRLPLHPRTRASSHPPINDPLPTTKQQSTSQGEEDVDAEPTPADQEEIYDTLPPANERIYDVTPVRYLHQSIGEGVGSPAVEFRKPLRLRQEEEKVEEGRREERKSRSSSEKTHSSRGREERGRESGRERERERKRDRDEKEREKEQRHHSHSAERSDTHRSSRHHDRDRERDRERERERDRGRHSSRHHSSSSDRHGRSKETSSSSSRKHGSSSKSSSSDHRKEDGGSKRLSSKEREKEKGKEKEEEKGKDKDKSILKGLRFSFRTKREKSDSGGKTSKSEREKSSHSSGRSSRHRHGDEEEEEGEGTLHRTLSRFSVVSTSAISSPKEKHPDAMKKTTSLTSLSMSGSSQGSPIPSHDGGHDVLV